MGQNRLKNETVTFFSISGPGMPYLTLKMALFKCTSEANLFNFLHQVTRRTPIHYLSPSIQNWQSCQIWSLNGSMVTGQLFSNFIFFFLIWTILFLYGTILIFYIFFNLMVKIVFEPNQKIMLHSAQWCVFDNFSLDKHRHQIWDEFLSQLK